MKKLICTIAAVFAVLLVGCSAMMDVVTPCYVEPEAIGYAEVEPKSFMPFTSVWDAERIAAAVDHKHALNQINLSRQLEDEDLKYQWLKKLRQAHIADARQFQSTVLSPENPIGMGLAVLTGGVFGAFAIKRPGDKTGPEFAKAGRMNPEEFEKQI